MLEIINRILSIMSNDHLSYPENFIIWLNIFGAGLSLFVNEKAFKHGIPRLRKAHFFVAGFASVYIIGYLFLMISDINFLLWSSTMRGISIFVWLVVWTYPAYVSVKIWADMEAKIKERGIDKK